MATACKKTFKKAVVVEESEKVVKLELTEDEALFWYAVTYHIAGSPKESYRKYSTALANALSTAGLYVNYGDYVHMGRIEAKACK